MKNTLHYVSRTACRACFVAAVVFPLGVSAQQTTPAAPRATPSEPRTTPMSKSEGSPITLTGCVTLADAASDATSTPGAVPKAGAGHAAKFILSNVERNAASSQSMTGTTGTTGTMGSTPGEKAAKHTTFALVPDSSIALDGHVNHKVEVTGTMSANDLSEPKTTGSATAHAEPTPNPAAIGTSGKSKMPSFKVKSLRMVASSCM